MKIAIFHGLGGNAQENWFPWAKQKLEAAGHQVIIPDLPQTENPSIAGWVQAAKEAVGQFDQETYLVGHSLGATLILHLLADLPLATKVGGALLIATPMADLGWTNLKQFFSQPLEFLACRDKFQKLIILHSSDDPYVPVSHAKQIKQALPQAQLIIFSDQGHFNTETNEAVLQIIRRLIS